jgi:tartrate-resistant acid phosphatase type 5
MFYKIIVVLLTNFLLINCQVAFMSIGDWGGASLGGYHYKNAIDTSKAMLKFSKDLDTKFVLNTGDNFYYCGIVNLSDPLITDDYINIYGQINIPWYNSLGNHDYGFNPEIQLQLNSIIPNWILENRYYIKRLIFNNTIINIIVLDTSPCIKDYRSNDRSKWDPCGLEFPTCGPEPGICSFHDNIKSQNCTEQLIWFNNTINNINENEWTIVIGHHRADQINVEDFNSILQNNKIHLYINGHIHALQHYRLINNSKYITSGAGSMVMVGSEYTTFSHDVWRHDDTGFTVHVINKTSLETFFINKKGEIIYNFIIYNNEKT